MSQELHRLLQERAQVGLMKWPAGMAISASLHLGFICVILFIGSSKDTKVEATKVTWVALPAAPTQGTTGGSDFQEKGQQGERVRRVDKVAPKAPETVKVKPDPPKATPNAFGTKKTTPVKGSNIDTNSMGKAKIASKGANPT